VLASTAKAPPLPLCEHSAGAAPNPPKAVSTFQARSSEGRYTFNSGHSFAPQRTPLWADFVAEVR